MGSICVNQRLKNDGPWPDPTVDIFSLFMVFVFIWISGQTFISGNFFDIHSHNSRFSVPLAKSEDVAKQGPCACMVLLAGVE